MYQGDCPASFTRDIMQNVHYRAAVREEEKLAQKLTDNDLAATVGKYAAITNPFVGILRTVGFLGGEPARVTAHRRVLQERIRFAKENPLFNREY